MISVIVPVYKDSPLLKRLIDDLLKDPYEDKEIIVSIDEPTRKSTALGKKYSKDVEFIFNINRLGKAKALNNAVKNANGDILLFFDADVKIVSKNFLSSIENGIKDVDILDIKKTIIKGSRLSKMANYEFMTANILTTFFSRMKRCLGLNGAAFAIKAQALRDIGGFKESMISEDLELGIQTYLKNKVYKYSKDIEVATKSKDTWREWLIQRKRWSLGSGQFFKCHWRELIRATVKNIHVALMILFFTWPLIITSLVFNTVFENVLLLSLLTLSLKFSILLPIFLITGFGFLLFRNFVAFLIVYSISAALFYTVSRKLEFNYNFKDFTIYYFFYSPIWFTIFFYGFLKGALTKSTLRLKDWKIA